MFSNSGLTPEPCADNMRASHELWLGATKEGNLCGQTDEYEYWRENLNRG